MWAMWLNELKARSVTAIAKRLVECRNSAIKIGHHAGHRHCGRRRPPPGRWVKERV